MEYIKIHDPQSLTPNGNRKFEIFLEIFSLKAKKQKQKQMKYFQLL